MLIILHKVSFVIILFYTFHPAIHGEFFNCAVPANVI